MTKNDFLNKLQNFVESLTQREINKELSSILSQVELAGLEKK